MSDKKITRQVSIFINDREVVNSLGGVEKEMGKVRGQLRNLNKDSTDYDEKLDSLKDRLENLKTKQSYYKDELYGTNSALEDSSKGLQGVEKRMQEVSKELTKLDKNSADYKQQLEALGNEYQDLEKQQQSYRDEIKAATAAEVKHKNSLESVENEMADVSSQMRKLDKDSANYREEMARLKKEYAELEIRQAAFKEEIHGTTEEMLDARGAFSSLFSGFRSGNMLEIQQGFNGIKGGLKGMLSAAGQFIATPIGATIAGITAAFYGASKLDEYNRGLEKMNKELRALGINKDSISQIRSEILATAETYNQEFSELSKTVNSLAKSYKISMTEANDEIARGLAEGGEMNKEYLENIGEYDVFFKDMGFKVREFINIINIGPELGVYTDKLPDALKEAKLALTENTKATSDALSNAFGKDFSEDLIRKVKYGEITVKEALVNIYNESQRLLLDQQQQAQMTADVFKGAGEDAGGMLAVMEAVGKSANKEMSRAAKSSEELRQANEMLNKSTAKLFEIEGYGSVWDRIKSVSIITISIMMEHLARLGNFMANLPAHLGNVVIGAYNKIMGFTATLVKSLAPVFKMLGADVSNFAKQLEGLKSKKITITALFKTENADKKDIAAGEAEVTKNFKAETEKQIDALTRRKERLEALGKDTFKVQEQILLLQMKLAKKESAEYEALTNQLIKLRRERAEKLNSEEEKLRKAAAAKLDIWSKAYLKGEEEINKLLLDAAREREANQMEDWQREDEAIRNKWNDQIDKYAGHLDRIAELEAARDAELEDKRIEREQAARDAKIQRELESEERAAEINREIEDERLAAMFSNADYLAEFELEQQRRRDLQKAVQAQASAEEIEAINKKYDERQKKTGVQMLDFIIGLKAQEVKWEEMSQTSKLALIKQGLNGAADMFNKGSGAWKALKIAEVTIATAQGAINAYNAMSVIPIVGPVLGGIAAAAVAVMGAKQISTISKTKIEKQPKFFYGGHTGTKTIYDDEYGGVTGAVHKNEYVIPAVMTANPRYANVIGWLEQERQGKSAPLPGAAAGATAADGSRSSAGSDGAIIQMLQQVNMTMASVAYFLQNPVAPNLNVGYKHIKEMEEMKGEMNNSNSFGTINS